MPPSIHRIGSTRTRATTYELFGLQIGDAKLPNPMTAMFCLVAAVVLCYAVANLRRSTTGRQMLAVRSNERAAAAAGVSVAGTKLLGFALSASIAGIAGAIIAYRSSGASPDRFDYLQSLVFFAYAYLGGISSVAGAIIGGLIVSGGLLWTFLIEVVGISSDFTFLLGGVGLIVAAIFAPDGAAGRLRHSLRPPARSAARSRFVRCIDAHTCGRGTASTEQNRVGE